MPKLADIREMLYVKKKKEFGILESLSNITARTEPSVPSKVAKRIVKVEVNLHYFANH